MQHPEFRLLEVPEGSFSVLVVVNSFNSSETISRALDSIISQDFDSSFKVLVHDDGSTDNSREIIEQYREKHPELIFPAYRKVNGLTTGGRVTMWGIIEGLGFEFLMMCDGDDFWSSNMLREQVRVLETNQANVLAISASTCIGEMIHCLRLRYLRWRGCQNYCHDLLAFGHTAFQPVP